MLRLRGWGVALTLLLACGRKEEPEPLASYGAERLFVFRSTDIQGLPIVFVNLGRGADDDDCPPLAPVRATIDGRTLAMNPGGNTRRPCFGATFKAPLVVLQDGVDVHELAIADEGGGAEIRASVAHLGSAARLSAVQDGDVVRVHFDQFIRGRLSEARARWSGTLDADVAVVADKDVMVVSIPPEVTSGRVVLEADLIVDLDVATCTGIAACEAKWFVHEVFDLSVAR